MTASQTSVDLYWIPLGAGSPIVQASGRAFEAIAAAIGRRPRCDLYHSALEVRREGRRHTIEMTPVPDRHGELRGVVGEGAVGLRCLGRLRTFRYELRCWQDGAIPDASAAVEVRRVTTDPEVARAIVDLVASVPTQVWGRDELRTGGMWNSNSVTAWLLATAGIDASSLPLPAGGRAPGWHTGWIVAARSTPPVSA